MLLCKPVVVKGIIKPDVHHCRMVLKKCNTEKCNIEVVEAPSIYVESEWRNFGNFDKKSDKTRKYKESEN